MKPLQFSSGEILADRRADYAEMLFAAGDIAAASEVMRGATTLAPLWAAGWFRLGEMLEAAGERHAAAAAWEESLWLDPEDRLGAGLRLSLIGRESTTAAPSSAFVETLFDQYAEKFDAALVEKLRYRAPDLLFDAIRATGRGHFARALDLGCGTGLMGERLRPVADWLEGVDLSAEMLKKAEAKGVYDRLEKADLRALRPGEQEPDLVTATDVFMYVGALDQAFAAVAALMAPSGLFAFSAERYDGPEDFLLRPSRRYAHSEAYLRDLLSQHGFHLVSLSSEIIRHDAGEPVEGLIVVVAR